MKHLNPELERLEQRIAPGLLDVSGSVDASADIDVSSVSVGVDASSVDVDVDASSVEVDVDASVSAGVEVSG